MRKLVERFGCGVVVDHSDVQSIRQGIQSTFDNRTQLSDRATACARTLLWNEQDNTIESIVNGRMK